MYFIPGYVTVRYDHELAYLISRMLHNEVCISEPQYLNELKCILKEGCDNQNHLELYKKLINRNLMITLMPTLDEKSGVIWNPEIENLWTESKFEEKCFKCPSILVCMNMRCRKGIITEGKDYSTCTKILSEIY